MLQEWKIVYKSVAGTSHERSSLPCQDCSRVRELNSPKQLVIACADGAGSSPLSDQGAAIACETVVALLAGNDFAIFEKSDYSDVIREANKRARDAIAAEASRQNKPIGDFACTLLTAIIAEDFAAFSQIGDGAIVIRRDDKLVPVFWPQTGEYANVTNFITATDYEEQLVTTVELGRIDEIAVLTDGLQTLALHFETRTAHAPFFDPMFRSLRTAAEPDKLGESLVSFLSSGPVNERTDDDKTLILASRSINNHALPATDI